MRIRMPVLLLGCLLLLPGFGCSQAEAGDYPYELQSYRSLDLPDAFRASFSHDGEIIIFYSNAEKEDKIESIWVANEDGSDRRALYRNSSIEDTFSCARFGPDGDMIVYVHATEYISILAKNDSAWNEDVTMTHLHVGGASPSFSPDGTKIIYSSGEAGGKGDVWVMDIDGTNRTRLSFDKDGGMSPGYSSDGKRILYERWSDNGESEIWVMNSDGTDQSMVLDDSWYSRHPSFMPDGKILFESSRASPHSDEISAGYLWMMDQDGSNRILLVPSYFDGMAFSSRPSVSSDNTKILFEHGLSDLYIVEDPDGDGVWEDSDGDGVADVCDGYPDDPDRGYLRDGKDENDDSPGFGVGALSFAVLVAVPALWWKRGKS